MKRMILGMSLVAALLLTASSAMAAAGVNLRWTNCFGDAGVQNRISACLTTLGSAGTMVGSFELATAITGDGSPQNVGGVSGIEGVLDLIAAGGALPAWWDFSAPGGTVGCRGTALAVNPTISGLAVNCFDWAGGSGAGGLAAYTDTGTPAGTPGHRRIKLGFAVATPVDLPAATEFFAFNALISNAKTTGAGACTGCAINVCIVLNSILVQPGILPGIILGSGTAPGTNIATWQASVPGDCAGVPTKNATWSQVKSLYR